MHYLKWKYERDERNLRLISVIIFHNLLRHSIICNCSSFIVVCLFPFLRQTQKNNVLEIANLLRFVPNVLAGNHKRKTSLGSFEKILRWVGDNWNVVLNYNVTVTNDNKGYWPLWLNEKSLWMQYSKAHCYWNEHVSW